MKEKDFYEKIKDWDFSHIKRETEKLTDWKMYEILKNNTNQDSKILDLGTGGGEKVIKCFPEVKEILGTDYSFHMIETANKNLEQSGRKNITFRVMDNLAMDVPDNYYDVVVARNTCTDPKQIYKCLKKGGLLLIHGVDKMDCYELKRIYGKGQGMGDLKPISVVDYERVLEGGFIDTELVPIHEREFYKTKEDLYALLLKTPILDDFSEIDEDNTEYYKQELDNEKIDEYIKRNTYEKGIRLVRRYYGITARK
jgi:ubiquinone/menaquinone biosynthesis C-methylase UbiE